MDAPLLSLTRISPARRGRLFVASSAVTLSTAGVLQRSLRISLATQLAGRALFAVLAMGGVLAVVQGHERVASTRSFGAPGVAIACLMAVSSASFIAAIAHGRVANVLLIQALAPIIAAVLGAFALAERVTASTWVATGLAFIGVFIMVGRPAHLATVGTGLAFLMTLTFAATIVLTRRHREISMVPAMVLSQFLVLVTAAPFVRVDPTPRQMALLALMGTCQLALGLMFLVMGARLIHASEVALLTLLEVVLGPVWVWWAFSERPSSTTLVGGAVVLAAVTLHVLRVGGLQSVETRTDAG